MLQSLGITLCMSEQLQAFSDDNDELMNMEYEELVKALQTKLLVADDEVLVVDELESEELSEVMEAEDDWDNV
jgi:hypothetical protein